MTRPHAWIVATAVGISGATLGCDQREGPEPRKLSVAQLAELMKSSAPPRLYDANGDWTRREYGIIPGSHLLEDCSDYPLNKLPDDKSASVVFYCASSWCGAAEDAAERALDAGYNAVAVLPDGIKGWVKAGLPTKSIN